jgi:anthranilate synthase component 2/para-aminobenzoate synthetase
MKPHVLIVDHHDSYTWNLAHLVAAVTGGLPDVTQHDEPGLLERITVSSVSHLVLSPGPGHPANPVDFALGAGVFDLGRPVLGVCLGMQALVTSFGGTVHRAAPAHGEVAAINHDGLGVFHGLPQQFRAVRYHSLQAIELPDCLTMTAVCPASQDAGSFAIMGVRHVELPVEGVQFHPESILSEHGERLIANFLAER